MVRPVRPSQVYRLPDDVAQPAPAPASAPEPPKRRPPLWVGIAGLVAVGLVVSGLVRGSGATDPGAAPVVDIISEDQAIAALALYGAQASTIADLQEHSDIFANPGPPGAVRSAAEGLAATQQALEAARDVAGADPLAAAYWNSAEHGTVVETFGQVRAEADMIVLLAATHDTLYSGTGSIGLQGAYDQISTAFAGQPWPRALGTWAQALLEQMQNQDRVTEAGNAREAVSQLWAARVAALEPAAVSALRDYVNGLPGATVEGLRGHPVAGPALKQLESEQRLVSVREPPPWLGP